MQNKDRDAGGGGRGPFRIFLSVFYVCLHPSKKAAALKIEVLHFCIQIFHSGKTVSRAAGL